MKLNKVQTRDKNFARIYNEILQDKNLSWKARGIFCYLWSLPDDWNYKERNIAKQATDGISSLTSGVKELRANHYLVIKRDNNGYTSWYLSDHKLRPHHGNPDKENPDMEKPYKENHDVLQNTNPYKRLNKQTIRVTSKKKLRSEVTKDLEVMMVQVNDFVLQDVDDMIKTYPSKLIFKAIHMVGTRNPNPKYVVKDIWDQLHNGCQVKHYQPKQRSYHTYRKRQPIKEAMPEWSKHKDDGSTKPTDPKLIRKIHRRLHKLGEDGRGNK